MCFTLQLLLGFRVARVYYLVVVVCYRLVYTVHCVCLWAWLGSYCSGPVIRKHLSSHIMLLFRVELRFLYPPSFRTYSALSKTEQCYSKRQHNTRAQIFPDHRTRAITPQPGPQTGTMHSINQSVTNHHNQVVNTHHSNP